MIPIVSNENKLRWEFENFDKIAETETFGDRNDINGIVWKIGGKMEVVENQKNFIVYLHYDAPNRRDRNWICVVNRTIKLLDLNGKLGNIYGTNTAAYNANILCTGCRFTDNLEPYKKDDTIIVEIELDFKYYDFSKNIPNYTDIILKVRDTEFHVNKGVLCSRSEYFNDLLVRKNSQETTINIKNVTASTFCFFVASFFPFFSTVYESNYASLINLATKYGVATLHSNCEQFLITHTKIGIVDKLKYAQGNGYSKLKKSCIESLNSAQQIKQLQNTAKFHKLDDFTKLAVMSRILDFV